MIRCQWGGLLQVEFVAQGLFVAQALRIETMVSRQFLPCDFASTRIDPVLFAYAVPKDG